MTTSISPLMPDQIIECISTGRDPTVRELFEVAERMWTDGAAGRSAFGWGRLSPGSSDRMCALRGAQLALSGNRDPAYDSAEGNAIMARDASKDVDLRLPSRNPDWSADVITRSGYAFHLRRSSHDDETALAEFAKRFDPDALQSRFLEGAGSDEKGHLPAAVEGSDRRADHFLAIERDTDRILSTAGIAIDNDILTARAALVIRPDYDSGGIRWSLLEHIAHFAASAGVRTLEAIERREGQRPADLDRRPGWTVAPYASEPTMIVWRKSFDQR